MTALQILHLYPQELGVFGDVGNVLALQRRSEWRGLDVTVWQHQVGAALPKAAPDILVVGNGPHSGMRAVSSDLQQIAPALREWVSAGAGLLAVAAGWQLLGQSLTIDGEAVPTAAVLPSVATVSKRRFVSEIVAHSSRGLIMGFENHAAVTELVDGAQPLATDIKRGFGNGVPEGAAVEGVLVGAAIGTNLGGPFLPLNPTWADYLLEQAVARRGEVLPAITGEWAEISDTYAEQARHGVANAVPGAKGWLVAGT